LSIGRSPWPIRPANSKHGVQRAEISIPQVSVAAVAGGDSTVVSSLFLPPSPTATFARTDNRDHCIGLECKLDFWVEGGNGSNLVAGMQFEELPSCEAGGQARGVNIWPTCCVQPLARLIQNVFHSRQRIHEEFSSPLL
jgi:hypothetical protein